MIAIDTETELIPEQGKVRTQPVRPRLVAMSWCDGTQTGVETDYLTIRKLVDGWVQDGQLLIFHNASFDVAVLEAWAKCDLIEYVRAGMVRDTLVMIALRDVSPNRQLTLQAAARKFCGIHLKKDDVRTSFRAGQKLSDQQRTYAAQDAHATYHLYQALTELRPGEATTKSKHEAFAVKHVVAPDRMVPHIELLDRAYSAVSALRAYSLDSSQSLRVDREKVKEYAAAAEHELWKAQEVLAQAGLGSFKRKPRAGVEPLPEGDGVSSRSWTYCPKRDCMVRLWKGEPQRVDAVFCLSETALREAYQAFAEEIEADDAPVSEKTGKLSLSYPYWRQHKGAMPPELLAHVAYQKAAKMLSTYYKPLLDSKGDYVAPSFNVGFAETGRWTCNRPNIQNVPKKQRDMFVSRLDEVFISADYSALEVWTLAHALCCFGINGPLVDVLREGVDLHTRTASLIFDVPEDQVTTEQRQGAKACNFGIPGGMGPKKFAATAVRQYRLPWTESYARAVRDKWLSVYVDVAHFLHLFKVSAWRLVRPGVNQWQLKEELGFDPQEYVSSFDLSKKLHGGRLYDVTLPSGRRFPNRTYSQAANVYLQGIGAEVTTLAVALLAKKVLPWSIAAVVHDSITLSVRDVDMAIRECSEALKHSMLAAQRTILWTMADYLPKIETEVSKEWR